MQTIGHNIMSETYGASIVSDDRDVLYHTPFEVFLTFRIPVFNQAWTKIELNYNWHILSIRFCTISSRPYKGKWCI